MANTADLRGFVNDGDAVHPASTEVTEEGTTAAAATALLTFRSGRLLQSAIFNDNHPFVYFIYDKPMRTVMFAGVYRAPNPPQGTPA